MHPYAQRSVTSLDTARHDGWQIKQYSIVAGDAPFDQARFHDGVTLALAALPTPAATPIRLGVGFIIMHQGLAGDAVVLGWWDRKHELPLRMFVRERETDRPWRPARGEESICVWDLQVISAERDAYVDTAMGGGTDAQAAYLARSAVAAPTGYDVLRHTIATLAYRAGKALRGAPPEFAALRVAPGSRTPAEILAHVGDLLEWAGWLARGEHRWTNSEPSAWSSDVERFFAGVQQLDDYLASGAPVKCSVEQLFQGPIADALTHVGQLTMLRRISGHPIRGENYAKANIKRGRVSFDQPAPRVEFD